MLRVKTIITVEQQTSYNNQVRDKIFELDFCVDFEIESTWENQTGIAKITLPKKIRIRDNSGGYINIQNRDSVDSNIGGLNSKPLFMRGDRIYISAGYIYSDKDRKEQDNIGRVFEGFISKVSSKKPFTLECQDNMWLLKQIPTPKKNWPKNYTLRQIVSEMISGTDLTISKKSEISVTYNIGTAMSFGNSVSDFLDDDNKNGFRYKSRFRGNELRIGYPIYYADEAVTHNFIFQQNIIEDELEYSRKDDIVLSAVVQNYVEKDTGKTTKDGKKKVKKERQEVLVMFVNGQQKSFIRTKTQDLPANDGGERYTFFYPEASTPQQLIDFGFKQLKTKYYDGFRGSFTAFGMPWVKYGDYVRLTDNILPERNGVYVIRKVEITGGTGGLRQKITLDFKITTGVQEELV